MLAFWQEFGRAGQDGKPATATWYAHGKADRNTDIFRKLRVHDTCVRHTVLAGFILPETDTTSLPQLANIYIDPIYFLTEGCFEITTILCLLTPI